jgi:NADPH-dependent 2,4-dienoyl-CoA reductase/sulfur reductase-like enzyme
MTALAIAGGGPAALSAARAYREAGGEGAVTMITPEPDPPYTRPALSKEFLRGETDDIALEDDAFYAQHEIERRHGATVTAIDPDARTLTLSGGETLSYETCVLATGAEPIRITDDPGVLTLRSFQSARRLRARAGEARTAVVIGSGFIGCEAAASLAMRGLRVTLVSDEHVPQKARLGEEAGGRIAGWLAELGVALQLGAPVESLDARAVRVQGAPPVEADLVLTALGIRPNAQLAGDAGIETDEGRVVTDERMRTSAHGVLAAGDVALARNAAAARRLPVEHWGEALAHGEIAGRVAAGAHAEWSQAPGFWSTIGTRTLKHVAWGDGFDEARLIDHPGGAFTVWYAAGGTTVGVLTHERDEDYERGRELVERGLPLP